MIYLFILIGLLSLTIVYDIGAHKTNKSMWIRIAFFVFVVLAGFRYRIGVDTINYLYSFYHQIPSFSNFERSYFEDYAQEPLFTLLEVIVKSIFGRFYVMQIVQALFVNLLIFKYIIKHSRYVFCCFLLYFVWIYPTYIAEEMRASMSVAICLYANDYFLEKKWIKALSLVIVASLFHYSSLLLLLTPFLLFLRPNLIGLSILSMALLMGYIVQGVLGDYLILLNMDMPVYEKLQAYSNSSADQKLNIAGIVGQQGVFMLYSYLSMKKNKNENLKTLEPFIMIGLISVLISIPIHIFYRYTHFYTVYFIIFFSNYFVEIVRRNLKREKLLAYVRALVIAIPFFFLIYQTYFPIAAGTNIRNYVRYCPYSSIFYRRFYNEREQLFNNYSGVKSYPNLNEY